MSYLAVLKASYDYSPQDTSEIHIQENQLLFLIDRTDDDWWKVKPKDSSDPDAPAGLVPAAYVEQAEHSYLVKALYDYDAAAPGELSIHEDDILMAFELDDNWLLVQSTNENGGAGFVPGNYVEETSEDAQQPPPPQVSVPLPTPRPVSTYVDPADRVAASRVSADDIKTYSVSEVDKKGKKKKGMLGVGGGSVYFASEADKTPIQTWKMNDIVNVSSEKAKHINIEIGGATPTSLLFNVGSKDLVDEISRKLESSLQVATGSTPDPELHRAPPKSAEKTTVRFSEASPTIIPAEVEEPEEEPLPVGNGHSVTARKSTNHGEPAIALYEFSADGDDELSVTEGEELLVIERDGDEWWKCRNARGAEGVVPASYIELQDSSSSNSHIPPTQRHQVDRKAEAATKAAQEAADLAEAERLQREEEERIARERKKQEAQRRAREASKLAETERQKRQEANAATAKKSNPPRSERKESISSTPKQEVTFPPGDKVRTWHDRSGQFRVDAAFLGFTSSGKLRLHKINGVIVEVPSEKMSVDDMKFAERLMRKSAKQSSSGRRVSEDDIPLGHLQSGVVKPKPHVTPTPKPKGPSIDWFDFFLSAGCEVDNCTQYAASFERDKIDESLLGDITESTLRTLGLREGDIIRVKKAIEKRKPGENMEKESSYIKEQLRRDEELAKQLQAQESTGGGGPAPNLFAGPGGVLKGPRRKRPQPTKTLPTNVDLDALSSASGQAGRASTPQSSNSARPDSAPPARSNSTPLPPIAANGFEDDAWAVRPPSTKPPTSASPAAAPTPPVPAPVSAPVAAATPAPAPTATAAAPTTTSGGLAKTDADIFDQLARLSALRQTTPQQTTQLPNSTTPTIVTPPSFQVGMGMGNSSIPMGQALAAQQTGLYRPSISPQPQPRGPFAPVPANHNLLQPLIPTQTGFNSFIPTRPNNNLSTSPFQNQLSPSPFLGQQMTGMPYTQPQQQPLMANPTGMPQNNMSFSASPFGSGSTFQPNPSFTPISAQPTGVFAQSPFSNPASPPPFSPSPSSGNNNTNSTSPANVFASMKSGTFAKDDDNAPRTNPNQQAQGWGYNGYGGY